MQDPADAAMPMRCMKCCNLQESLLFTRVVDIRLAGKKGKRVLFMAPGPCAQTQYPRECNLRLLSVRLQVAQKERDGSVQDFISTNTEVNAGIYRPDLNKLCTSAWF
ncbi:hypothetical protein PgNI_11175 [Pyricularia grisea]|uniref:Uncharacterized protein n=1 Tax=Pyricularia grisea TaxID=148305 RepID=A0A6P8AQ30_PYRGI|nr:hypothetical protein PgNI_11175 [Pyricularia grisea]TLD04132.1 hypothetical protein PgNI_11175 [Pyricularia grisea]